MYLVPGTPYMIKNCEIGIDALKKFIAIYFVILLPTCTSTIVKMLTSTCQLLTADLIC